MDDHTIFAKDALKAQDGKKVPLKDRPGGRIIGMATMRYDEGTGNLNAELHVEDPQFEELLKEASPQHISLGPIYRDYKKER